MADSQDMRPAVSPALFWRVLVVANIFSLGILLLAFHLMVDVAVMPEIAHWFVIAGVLMTLPAILYQQKTQQLTARQPGQSDGARQLLQLKRLVFGCALAELPGLMATLYYLFARDWQGTLVLLILSVMLLLWTRPS